MKTVVLVMAAISLVFGLWNRSAEQIGTAILSESTHAVELTLSLAGSICLWSGLMRIAQDSGLAECIARFLRPVLQRLFRGVKKGSRAMQLIAMNTTANLLGLGNAATPLGLAAMRELADDAPGGRASVPMIILAVMNTASIQLVPTTVAMMRLKHGAAEPFDILPAVLITSFSAAAAAIGAALCALRKKRGKR